MGELEYDIVVHSNDVVVTIYRIDQDEYSLMDLVVDIHKAMLLASNVNMLNENRLVDNMVAGGVNVESEVGNVEICVVNVPFEVGNVETDVGDNNEDNVYGFSSEDKDWRGEGDDVHDSSNDCQYVGPISTCEQWDTNSGGFSNYQYGDEGGNVETSGVNVESKFVVGNGETHVADNDKEDNVYGFGFEHEDWRGKDYDILDSRNDCQYVGPISTCEEWDANNDGFSNYQSGDEGGMNSSDSDDVENMNGDRK
ncbi:unnamed protein product [Ilex paraguariensis]|uniref:Uncharacterized protein n=1 Tax=Ilex paraguariensis TaxID=185542 RepID=A0ABC8QZJ9_9AQUA